jgi:hypothetical protein
VLQDEAQRPEKEILTKKLKSRMAIFYHNSKLTVNKRIERLTHAGAPRFPQRLRRNGRSLKNESTDDTISHNSCANLSGHDNGASAQTRSRVSQHPQVRLQSEQINDSGKDERRTKLTNINVNIVFAYLLQSNIEFNLIIDDRSKIID